MLKCFVVLDAVMCLRYDGIMPGTRALTQSETLPAVRVITLAMSYAAPVAAAPGSTPMTIVVSFS